MLMPFSLLLLSGCTESPDLLSSEVETVGVSSETIVSLESELDSAYALWEEEEYDEAFIVLEHINHESMKLVWPVLRSEDAESTLHLEVQFGKVLWSTERKRSIVNNEAAGSLKRLLLRELNDVRLIEPVPNESGGGNLSGSKSNGSMSTEDGQ